MPLNLVVFYLIFSSKIATENAKGTQKRVERVKLRCVVVFWYILAIS